LFYANYSSVSQSFAQGFFHGTCSAKIVILVLNSQWNCVKTVLLLFFEISFLFRKGITDRVPVKSNSVDCGPSL